MARFRAVKDPEPIKIDKWIGINEAVGLTNLKPNESLKQVNFRITKDYKPQKRPAHNIWIDFQNTKSVQGVWYGFINTDEVLITCNDGKVYKRNMTIETTKVLLSELITDGVVTQIGTITDAKTSILYFQDKLYFWNGVDFKQYDGTTFQDVIPYEPTIVVGAAPSGGGIANEPVNLLTGAKKMSFVGDGTATIYQLPEMNIDADVLQITVNGVNKVEGIDFTVNRALGQVTFISAPANLASVIIRWVKVEAGNANLVKKNKYVMAFGPGNDTSLFLWGNTEQKNRRTWSASLNPAYFPVYNFTLIGSNEFAITDIKSVYNRQIIFKEDRTHYSYPEYISTLDSYDYPVYDLNEKIGNIASNQVQIIENNPVSIKGQSWWKWSNTNIEDERNANVISERLQQSLSSIDLSNAITFDYQSQKEFWCNVGSIVYIWNYGNDTMYMYDNISGNCFIDINNTIFYGSTHGTIEKFGGLNDNNQAIIAYIETGFNPYGAIHLVKSSDTIYISLLPDSKTSITVSFKTNKKTDWKLLHKKAEYALLDFEDVDFDDFTFLTNRNPQTFALPFNSGDYTYIQYRFENSEINQTCTMLDFLVSCESQGEVL